MTPALVPAKVSLALDALDPIDLAARLSKTDFVPKSMSGKPEAVLAALLFGQEIGLGPMQSLQSINVIQGRPSLSPEGMRALVQANGHRLWPETTSDERIVLCGARRDWPNDVVRVTWTLDDAKRAGLNSDAWKKYPRAMLLARATSELCRTLFADVIGGLSYTPEEVESFDPEPPKKRGRRTTQTAPASERPEAPLDDEIVDAQLVEVVGDVVDLDAARSAADSRKSLHGRAEAIDSEFRSTLFDAWRDADLGKIDVLVGDDLDRASSILTSVEETQEKAYLARRIEVIAQLATIGIASDATGDRHAFIHEATGGSADSAKRLSGNEYADVLEAIRVAAENQS